MSSLGAQADERKKRLAQLKGLKRKQVTEAEDSVRKPDTTTVDETAERGIKLSGRNFDVEERVPKMGFTHAPNEGQETIETRADEIVEAAKAQQAEEEAAEKPIDLFNLQPKKPNWDLKRDVEKKLERLKPRTKDAIAKLVRERINSAKVGKEGGEDQAANSAMEGKLAELVKEREKERGEDDEEMASHIL
ncbi:cwf18 pre-mRNA splicing factor-domain-containing protein [Terfezia claveryi]|nr:cwf18 pre-mRNA splicing factor-domain-containing protein [Terfezia claveryi]